MLKNGKKEAYGEPETPDTLDGGVPDHAVFRAYWPQARPDSFEPPASVANLRLSKAV